MAVSRTRWGWVGETGSDREALVADELAVVVDPAPVAVGVELADQQPPRVVAMIPPAAQQRLEGSLLGPRQLGPIGIGRLEQDVEIADGPEAGGDFAKSLAVGPRPAGPEGVAEDAPRRPLAPGRDPHPVELLGVDALAGAGLAGEHPGEVEAEDLAAGLGDVVVGEHAGRLAGDEAGSASGSDSAAPARTGPGLGGSAWLGLGLRLRPRLRLDLGSATAGSVVGSASDRGLDPLPAQPLAGSASGSMSARNAAARLLRRPVDAWIADERRPRASSPSRSPVPGRRPRTASIGSRADSSPSIELHLELHEAVDDPASGDGIDLVEAQLDDRVGRLQLPLPPELADRHELDERRIAALLEDQRARVRRRPVARASRPVGRTLELLAPMRAAVPRRAGRAT